jgi:hypothetical protein
MEETVEQVGPHPSIAQARERVKRLIRIFKVINVGAAGTYYFAIYYEDADIGEIGPSNVISCVVH